MDLSNVPEHTKVGLLAMNSQDPLSHLSAKTRPDFARSIVSRYLDGEEIEDMASTIGVTPGRLYQILIEGDSEAWRSAQASKALEAFRSTFKELEGATNGLMLARARETHKSAQWQLEKLLRRLYGDDKTAINVNAAGNVTIQVVSFSDQSAQVGTEPNAIAQSSAALPNK